MTGSFVGPRVLWVPPCSSSLGPEAVELAASAGLVLDEWQAFVLENSLGLDDDGRWAAFEVGLVVSRQNGKGALIEARELAGLFLIGDRLIVHSAHQFDTSMEAFLRMDELLESNPELSRRVLRVSRSHGSEGFTLRTGQRLRYRARTKGGGRGFTADCLIFDESMILPEAAHGSILPTLSARANPQVWYTGSAVDQLVHDDATVFARVRERGIRGGDPSLAFFEWSAGVARPEDVTEEMSGAEQVWLDANPALGIRISRDHVENERRSMDARTFAVERLGAGDWPAVDGTAGVINLERWLQLVDVRSQAVDPVCFAFDVSPDRSFSTVAAAGRRVDGLGHLEVVDRRRGTGWLVDRLVELGEAHDPVGFVCDGSSPAASLIHALEAEGLNVLPVSAKEHAAACGMLFDMVHEEPPAVRHLGTLELTSALRGAAKRPLGDAWAWSRKNSAVDISPLVAVTLAWWGSVTQDVEEGAGVVYG